MLKLIVTDAQGKPPRDKVKAMHETIESAALEGKAWSHWGYTVELKDLTTEQH